MNTLLILQQLISSARTLAIVSSRATVDRMLKFTSLSMYNENLFDPKIIQGINDIKTREFRTFLAEDSKRSVDKFNEETFDPNELAELLLQYEKPLQSIVTGTLFLGRVRTFGGKNFFAVKIEISNGKPILISYELPTKKKPGTKSEYWNPLYVGVL